MEMNVSTARCRLVIALALVALVASCARDAPAPGADVTAAKIIENPNAYVGNRVQLTDLKVHSVVGDRTFWIGPSDKQRLFVVLDKSLDQPMQQEWRLDINEGQTVAISGEIRKVPSADEIQSRWTGLNASERTPLENQQVYLHAEQVDIAK
jgi:hypothetical protein